MTMRIFNDVGAALTAVVCAVTMAGPAFAGPPADHRGKLIHRTVDASRGAVIRLYQRTASDLTLEIEGRDVLFTKRVGMPSSEITVSAGKHRIAFVVAPMLLTVSSAAGTVRMTPATAKTTRPRLEELIRASAAYRAGVALLKRVTVSERTPLNL